MRKIQFVGIDVDDHGFHVAVQDQITNKISEFHCKPDASTLAGKLEKCRLKGRDFKVCYEATHLGFSLYRKLKDKGLDCDVIAPSLIPDIPGRAQKTNRLDAKLLAEFYAKGLLTSVHVPEFDEEMDRDFLRSRKFLVEQLTALKNHITGLCKRLGWDYRTEKQAKTYWTNSHLEWLRAKEKSEKNLRLKLNIKLLVRQFDQLNEQIGLYDEEIENMSAEERYQRKAMALGCYRGLATASAMTLITEIGDVNRFDKPGRLASYCGFDLREYSTGIKTKRFGISKNGNRHIRTAVIEACQRAFSPPVASKALKERRKRAPDAYIGVADRCMTRLYKKGGKLIHRGKHRNVAKTACAREMLCFIWESLRLAA